MNPVHPAPKSRAEALIDPMFFCTIQAAEGKGISPVTVATKMTSICSGLIPAAFRAFQAAWVAKVEAVVFSSAIRRSLIPGRSTIHWSEVSTIFSRSELVNTFSGTAEPVPIISGYKVIFLFTLHMFIPHKQIYGKFRHLF